MSGIRDDNNDLIETDNKIKNKITGNYSLKNYYLVTTLNIFDFYMNTTKCNETSFLELTIFIIGTSILFMVFKAYKIFKI